MTTLYGIKNCDTIKKARRWLTDNDIEYRFEDLIKDRNILLTGHEAESEQPIRVVDRQRPDRGEGRGAALDGGEGDGNCGPPEPIRVGGGEQCPVDSGEER